MSWFSSEPDPKPHRKGGYVIICDLRKPGDTSKCKEEVRAKSVEATKDLWKDHKKWHTQAQRDHVRNLKNRGYSSRLAELVEEHGGIDNIPKRQFSGLHTRGIPNVPDGQNVNGLVYDKDGKRVTFEELKKYVQGWDD